MNAIATSLTRPFGGLLLALLLACALPLTAHAQEETETTANAEARTQFGDLLESASALTEAADAASLVQAGETYLEAADVAEASGDAELEARASNAREQAVKAFVDAGSAFSAAEAYAEAAAQFERAAEVAEALGNDELQAKAYYNASVAYVSLKDVENALGAIDRAIALAPGDLNYLYVRGVTLRSNGDVDGAVAAFTELDSLATAAGDEGMSARARENIGKTHLIVANALVKEKQYGQAITSLDQAAAYVGEDDATLNTLYANAYYRLGVEQVQKEQLGAAEGTLQKAKQYAQKAGRSQIIDGAQAQLDYIKQVREHQQQ